MTADPKRPDNSHLLNPQKWNKYTYTLDNPLTMIDPDGQDPIFVFRPVAKSNGDAWDKAVANAKAHGNDMHVYNDKNATVQRMQDALQTPDAHIVFDGHTVNTQEGGQAQAIHLADGDMGQLSSFDGQSPIAIPEFISAPTVGVFGCNSFDLSGQFGSTTFTGIASGTDGETSLPAIDSAALAYSNALGSNESNGQAAKDANQALAKSKDSRDNDGDQVMTRNVPELKKPEVPK